MATTVAAFGAATTLGLGSSTGTLTLNNPTIVSSTTSLTLFNTVATTVNAFGAAATLAIGSSAGTVTIANPTVATGTTNLTLFNTNATTVAAFGAATTLGLGSSTGTLTLSNPTIVSSTTSLTLFNTVATTVNAFGAAATLNLGSSAGTVTVANATATFSGTTANFSANTLFNLGTSVTGASTVNIGTGAVAGAIKAINIGTGGSGTGTSTIIIGTTSGTSTITLNGVTSLSTALAIGSGGTGTSSFTGTDKTLVYYDTAGRLANISSAGTSGQALISGGTGAVPSWGTLGVAGGGTGLTSYTIDGIVYATGSTTLASSANFKFNASTTSGAVTTSAFYVNTAVTTGTGLHLSAANLASGNALIINAGSGSYTSGKLIDAQNNSVSKFSVDFNGNLRATTKSFDIEHPTKPGKRLVYGVLEGPEHGVYHRGTVEGKGLLKIELPEYWHKLVGEDYSIQLTPWGNYAVHIVEKTENYFIIQLSGNFISQKFKNIKVDYIIHGSRIDAPLEIEQD